jgi:hypothetical protein
MNEFVFAANKDPFFARKIALHKVLHKFDVFTYGPSPLNFCFTISGSIYVVDCPYESIQDGVTKFEYEWNDLNVIRTFQDMHCYIVVFYNSSDKFFEDYPPHIFKRNIALENTEKIDSKVIWKSNRTCLLEGALNEGQEEIVEGKKKVDSETVRKEKKVEIDGVVYDGVISYENFMKEFC